MVIVSSALASSRVARITRRVSSASGRTWETASGTRDAAREIAGVDRGPFPFAAPNRPGTIQGIASLRYARRVNGFNPQNGAKRHESVARIAVEDSGDLSPWR